MPWCAWCREEYAGDETVCPACGRELVDNLPEGQTDGEEWDAGEPVFLLAAEDGTERSLLEARLKSAGIPCLIRDLGDDGQLRMHLTPFGGAPTGGEFFVPAQLLPAARQAVGLDPVGEADGDEEAASAEEPFEAGEADPDGFDPDVFASDEFEPEDSESDEPGEPTPGDDLSVAGKRGRRSKKHAIPAKWTWWYLGRRITVAVLLLLALVAYFAFDGLLGLFRSLFGY